MSADSSDEPAEELQSATAQGRLTLDQLIDGWESAWSGKDVAAFAEVCAADIHYEDPVTPEPLEGLAELGRHAARLWSAFPDARLERAGERLGNGRFGAAPSKLLGTHRAPLEGLPATNRFIVVHGVFYCELEHDRLHRVRAFYDLYEAATQLGILPGRGTLGEKALLMLRGFGLRGSRSQD
jgi:steroid delta-isomerase-like uncharacterized protein